MRPLMLAACFFLPCVAATTARATLVITVRQEGGDVVARGAGSVNTAGLTPGPGSGWTQPAVGGPWSLQVGSGLIDTYTGLSGPGTVGPFDGARLTPLRTGDPFGVQLDRNRLFVPRDYVSGANLSGTATVANATIASLGLTEGIYLYTWGSGLNADSLTIDISAVPESGAFVLTLLPATVALVLRHRSRSN